MFSHGRDQRLRRLRKDKSWYRLDNAGKLYPALISKRTSSMFRLSLELREPVSLPLLNQALRQVMPRFPYYKVSLRPGLFWYFLETNHRSPAVEGDSRSPCTAFPLKHRGMFLFRVRVYKCRIALEFSHIITDATGAMIFLKTLTASYLNLKGSRIKPDRALGIFSVEEDADPREFEDGFQKNYNPRLPRPGRSPKASHLRGKLIPSGQYNIITGILSAKEAKSCAAVWKVSLGEFLIAQLMEAFYQCKGKSRKTRPIRLNVPVNLRAMYPVKSMRNFFLSVEPWIDPRLGSYSFEEICQKVHHYMRYEVDRKFLNQQITRNVKGELNVLTRLLPLPIKNAVMPVLYNTLGENNYSTGFSNLGQIKLPESMKAHVRSFDFYAPPSTGNLVKCTTLSYGDELRISFGSLLEETELECRFFRALRKRGLAVRIESNRV